MGRFLTPDPIEDSVAKIDDPQSWNQYSYVEGNPLTARDADGTCSMIIAGIGMSPDSESGRRLLDLAPDYGANVAFPYAGQSKAESFVRIALSGLGANRSATGTASNSLNATVADVNAGGGSVFALAFSGGAQASISAGA
jgi:hypothetical protein